MTWGILNMISKLLDLFNLQPTEIDIDGELSTVEVQLIRAVQRLEQMHVKTYTVLVGLGAIAALVWSLLGAVFLYKFDEYSTIVNQSFLLVQKVSSLEEVSTILVEEVRNNREAIIVIKSKEEN